MIETFDHEGVSRLGEIYEDDDYRLAPFGVSRIVQCQREILDVRMAVEGLAVVFSNLSFESLESRDESFEGIGEILRIYTRRLEIIEEEMGKSFENTKESKAIWDSHFNSGYENGYRDHVNQCDAIKAVGEAGNTELLIKYATEIKEATSGTDFESGKGLEAVTKAMRDARVSKRPISAKEAVARLKKSKDAKRNAGLLDEAGQE